MDLNDLLNKIEIIPQAIRARIAGIGRRGFLGRNGGSRTPAAVCFPGGTPERPPEAWGSGSYSRLMNSCGIELGCYARAATTVQNRCSSTTKLLSDYACQLNRSMQHHPVR